MMLWRLSPRGTKCNVQTKSSIRHFCGLGEMLGLVENRLTNAMASNKATWIAYHTSIKVGYLVSWCFEPSRPLGITPGLKTNFSPSLGYSAHKSLNVYHNFFTASFFVCLFVFVFFYGTVKTYHIINVNNSLSKHFTQNLLQHT